MPSRARAASFIRFLSGSYSGVVGLPLFETAQLLRGRRLAAAVSVRILAAASPGEVRVAVVGGRAAARLRDLAARRAGRRRRPASRPHPGARAGDGGGIRRARRAPRDSCPTARARRASRGRQPRRARHPRGAGRQGAAPDRRRRGGCRAGPPALLRGARAPSNGFAARYPGAPILVGRCGAGRGLRAVARERLSLVRQPSTRRSRTRLPHWREPSVVLDLAVVLHIHPTPALVAIDVDAGGATAARQPKAAAQLAANRAALPALARADPAAQPVGRDPGGPRRPVRPQARDARPGSRGGAGGRSAAPAVPRLHGARPRRDRAAARPSAAARNAGRAACGRAGRAAPDRGRRPPDPAPRAPRCAPSPAVVAALRARSGGAARPCAPDRATLDTALGSLPCRRTAWVLETTRRADQAACCRSAAGRLPTSACGRSARARCPDVDLGRWLDGELPRPGPSRSEDEDPPTPTA